MIDLNRSTYYGIHVHPSAEPTADAAIQAVLTALPDASVDDALDLIFALGCSHVQTTPSVLLPLLLRYISKTASIEVSR